VKTVGDAKKKSGPERKGVVFFVQAGPEGEGLDGYKINFG